MRLIDADALMKSLTGVEVEWYIADDGTIGDTYDTSTVVDIIQEQPAVEAEPVRHGRVVTCTDRWHTMHQTCSECGEELGWKEYPNYCPNCGAKMDGGAE